jgi:L-lysine 6-transaminase
MSTRTLLAPRDVLETIRRHLLADGYPIVFDLEKSHGAWVHDAVSGREFLDFYTFFASLPLGFGHPAFREIENADRLAEAALYKPSNSDAYSVPLARFVDAFARLALPEGFPHLFLVEGGTLAVENALKAAFDWKVRRNLAAGRGELGSRVLHFRNAFHGRSGYTLSLTNSQPVKTMYFPKFDWPRVSHPCLGFPVDEKETERVALAESTSLTEIEAAFDRHPHDIAAIIIEPIQGEGGDRHVRAEFLRALRRIADERDAILVFDEVQTGFGLTGRFWAFEHFGVTPDIVCFGKKAQVCGIFAGPRLDEVPDNVFHVPSRINSTWGGGLTDMVRCEIILETIAREGLVERAANQGARLRAGLEDLASRRPDAVSNPRGRGLMCAFDAPSPEARQQVLARGRDRGVLLLPCGERSIRFRPPLTIRPEEIDEGLRRVEAAL